ncbi:hypothetical protein JTE90_029000 [Oedothorax gibbosus]|uniref:DUF4371 domain-containing protein n=1 Tax=Oedothorax gibbosus TaxID=931172 RepID=A0AAV6VHV3_9ARAC|nr:hypothetical protein JTE90_029000 [Oedothorax gibbosus]
MSAKANASDISKTTTNEIIKCCGEEIVVNILKQVNASKYFPLIFDETTDVSHIPQLSLNIRYLDIKSSVGKEDFMGFIDLHKANYNDDDCDKVAQPAITGEKLVPNRGRKSGGKPQRHQSATGKDSSKKVEEKDKTGNQKGKGSGLKNTARALTKFVRKEKDPKEDSTVEEQTATNVAGNIKSPEDKKEIDTTSEKNQEFPRRFINNLIQGLQKEGSSMNDFPRLETLAALDARFDELSRGLGMNITTCNIPTLFEGITVPPGIVVQMQDRNKSKEERASIASDWASKYLMFAAPRKVALWCVNSFFLERGMTEICNPRYTPIVQLCQNSTAVESATTAQIATYGNLSRQFRQNLGEAVFPIAEFTHGEQNVQARVHINTALATRMLDMLTAMVAKRNARLGGGVPQQGQGCAHYDSYVDYLIDRDLPAMLPTNRRNMT